MRGYLNLLMRTISWYLTITMLSSRAGSIFSIGGVYPVTMCIKWLTPSSPDKKTKLLLNPRPEHYAI